MPGGMRSERGSIRSTNIITDTTTTVVEAADGQLVGMGNVCLGGPDAEAALLVEDGWQRRGLGVCLACLSPAKRWLLAPGG